MHFIFEPMNEDYRKDVIDIFNYYTKNSFAAYPNFELPYEAYNMFLEMTKDYPAYVIKEDQSDKILGFCFLRAYSPFPTFKMAAEISCFFVKEATGIGIGREALSKLEEDAKSLGIKTVLANISSENIPSIKFHQKHGFKECGRLHQVGEKFGKLFDVIWMQKEIN